MHGEGSVGGVEGHGAGESGVQGEAFGGDILGRRALGFVTINW